MFGLGQTKKKQETKAKERQLKAEEWNYKGDPSKDGLHTYRAGQHQRDQGWKETQRQTKADEWKYQGDPSKDGLAQYRAEQTKTEQTWKKTGRDQKTENTSFDMAKALFNQRIRFFISRTLRYYMCD